MMESNARIESTMLGIEDHGIMSFYLYLDYGRSGQGFGGYGLDEYDKIKECRIGHPKSIILIRKILEVVGVDKWEDLEGKYIKVKYEHSGVDGICSIIGDNWLMIKDFWEEK
jgi:hypothetical protein